MVAGAPSAHMEAQTGGLMTWSAPEEKVTLCHISLVSFSLQQDRLFLYSSSHIHIPVDPGNKGGLEMLEL